MPAEKSTHDPRETCVGAHTDTECTYTPFSGWFCDFAALEMSRKPTHSFYCFFVLLYVFFHIVNNTCGVNDGTEKNWHVAFLGCSENTQSIYTNHKALPLLMISRCLSQIRIPPISERLLAAFFLRYVRLPLLEARQPSTCKNVHEGGGGQWGHTPTLLSPLIRSSFFVSLTAHLRTVFSVLI